MFVHNHVAAPYWIASRSSVHPITPSAATHRLLPDLYKGFRIPYQRQWIQSITSHLLPVISISILSSHQHLGLPSGIFPSDFPTKLLCSLHYFSFLTCLLPAPSLASSCIFLFFFCSSSSLRSFIRSRNPSHIQIFYSPFCSQTPSMCVIHFRWDIKFHAHTKQKLKL